MDISRGHALLRIPPRLFSTSPGGRNWRCLGCSTKSGGIMADGERRQAEKGLANFLDYGAIDKAPEERKR
ncbi:hypothetical protein E4U55_001630, partial [Claviceps digitariae]